MVEHAVKLRSRRCCKPQGNIKKKLRIRQEL